MITRPSGSHDRGAQDSRGFTTISSRPAQWSTTATLQATSRLATRNRLRPAFRIIPLTFRPTAWVASFALILGAALMRMEYPDQTSDGERV